MKYSFLFLSLITIASLSSCSSEEVSEGDRLFHAGQYDEALKAYSDFLEYNTRNVPTLYNRGRTYEELGQLDKAREDFLLVLKLDPEHIDGHLSLGNIAYREKQYAEAVDYYKSAAKLQDRNATAFYLVGRAYTKLGKLEEALKAYNSSISLDKGNSSAYLGRGVVYANMNRMGKACTDFRAAKNMGNDGAAAAIAQYCE